MTEATCSIARLDRSKDPPGFFIACDGSGPIPIYRWARDGSEPAGEPCERREQAVHLAWNRYEDEHDPPGMWSLGGGWEGGFGLVGGSALRGGPWDGHAARAAAWAWYWRCAALAARLAALRPSGESPPPDQLSAVWPEVLSWSDDQLQQAEADLAEVEAALADEPVATDS